MGGVDKHDEGSLAPGGERQGGERREFARVGLELVVAVRYPTLGDVVRCKTVDISLSGAFVATKRPRDVGTRIKLSLEIDGHALELAGVVVRVRSGDAGEVPGMGLQFTDMTPGKTMLLKALLAKNVGLYEGAKVRRPR